MCCVRLQSSLAHAGAVREGAGWYAGMGQGVRTRAPAAVGRVHGPAEVGNLELAVDAQQQVLWLDVAVDHVLAVAVQQRARQRRYVPAGQQSAKLG